MKTEIKFILKQNNTSFTTIINESKSVLFPKNNNNNIHKIIIDNNNNKLAPAGILKCSYSTKAAIKIKAVILKL